jgi:hypothetical protein
MNVSVSFIWDMYVLKIISTAMQRKFGVMFAYPEVRVKHILP